MSDGFNAFPERIIDKGDNVKGIAQKCLTLLDDLKAEGDNISRAWEDEASKRYLAQINSYRTKFETLQVEMDKIGNILIRHGERLINTRDNLSSRADEI